MIIQIALGIVLAFVIIAGVLFAPVLAIPVLLFWFVLWLCTRKREGREGGNNSLISAVFAILTVFVLIVVFAPQRTRSSGSGSASASGLFIPSFEFPKAIAKAKAQLPPGTSAVFCPLGLVRHEPAPDGTMAFEFYHDEVTNDGSTSPRQYWRATFRRAGSTWALESVVPTRDFSIADL